MGEVIHKRVVGINYRDQGQTEYEYQHTSLCGYVRKNVSFDDKEVTCFYCKRLLTTQEKG